MAAVLPRTECDNGASLFLCSTPPVSAPLPSPDPSAGPVPSPCVSVCRMNAHTGYCEGCFRTIEEIARWSALPDAERRAVWRAIAVRRAAAGAARMPEAGRPRMP